MCPNKAPRSDGLTAVFFQKHWKAVREGVIVIYFHILNQKGNIDSLNHIYIIFTPKIKKLIDVTNYRSISLCNIIYRIIVKFIANRLKQILHDVISPN